MKLGNITLPDGLIWADRFAWTPVSQNISVSLTGTVIIQEATQATGRPITLEGGEDQCWISDTDLEALYATTQTANNVMTLDLDELGEHQVVWNRNNPIEVSQVLRGLDNLWAAKALRFIKVD